MWNRNVTERVKHICYYKFKVHSRREDMFFCHLVKASILFTSRPTLDGATLSIIKQKESGWDTLPDHWEKNRAVQQRGWKCVTRQLTKTDSTWWSSGETDYTSRHIFMASFGCSKATCLFIITNDAECDETALQKLVNLSCSFWVAYTLRNTTHPLKCWIFKEDCVTTLCGLVQKGKKKEENYLTACLIVLQMSVNSATGGVLHNVKNV